MFVVPEDVWEIKKTPNRGMGVFARKPIKPWRVIGDYLGTVIRPEEEDDYEKKFGLYAMWLGDDVTLFPDPSKPGVHIVNHACVPNCFMYPYRGHILYVAIRPIRVGEELTVSYLLDPNDEHPCVCKCGHPTCRGSMHVGEYASELWSQFVLAVQGDAWVGRNLAFGSDLKPLEDYPTFVPEEPMYNHIIQTETERRLGM